MAAIIINLFHNFTNFGREFLRMFWDVSPKMESELESIEGPSQHNEEEPLADTPDIDDLYDGFQLFEERNQASEVIHSDSHTVLFELPLPDDENITPIRREGEDQWNSNFVKLPCNPANTYAYIDEEGVKMTKPRWDLIKSSLTDALIKNSRQLEAAVKKYNSKSAQSWDFAALHELFEDEFSDEDSEYFFNQVLPKVIDLALRLPELIKHPIPFLKNKKNHAISLSQEQCACLLANAFLCTFPARNGERKNTDFPEINFNRLFYIKTEQGLEKIKCILNYFRQVCFIKMPTGVLTFQRRFIDLESCPNWAESDAKFSSMKLFVSSEGTIEDGRAMLQTDFANRYLGGGVLGWGCVQEEIRFVVCPEMIVGMLFCEAMNSKEAILMTGCEQFNKHKGYASSFKWTGSFKDETPLDQYRRKMVYVTAIDAICFTKPHLQFEENLLKRELNKAFVGFYHDPSQNLKPVPVISGNWGCGAFRGFKPLKALIQLMACCENQRNLAYFTFGEEVLEGQIRGMFEWLCDKEVTVGMLWKYLQEFRQAKLTHKPYKLYDFIKRAKEVRDVSDGAFFSGEAGTESTTSEGTSEEVLHPSKKIKIDGNLTVTINNKIDSDDTVDMEVSDNESSDQKESCKERRHFEDILSPVYENQKTEIQKGISHKDQKANLEENHEKMEENEENPEENGNKNELKDEKDTNGNGLDQKSLEFVKSTETKPKSCLEELEEREYPPEKSESPAKTNENSSQDNDATCADDSLQKNQPVMYKQQSEPDAVQPPPSTSTSSPETKKPQQSKMTDFFTFKPTKP